MTLKLIQPNPTVPATFIGNVGLSTDGLGIGGNFLGDPGIGTIQAEIPVGSTIEYAFLHVATRTSRGSSSVQAEPFRPGIIGFEGEEVSISYLDNVEDSTDENFETGRVDVTEIVRAKIGNAGGTFDFEVNERITGSAGNVEGTSLSVIYTNPSLPESTILLLEGGLTGPTPQITNVFLAAPINLNEPDFIAELALGIQFGSPTK